MLYRKTDGTWGIIEEQGIYKKKDGHWYVCSFDELDKKYIVINLSEISLQVEKITADTYAGETEYPSEQFILLDIYPKTNGTVNVTYGGLTKTIVDTSGSATPNAQQVFFGTFNGVSDSVATPANGELIITGGYEAFGVGYYNTSNKVGAYCGCITEVKDWGGIISIGDSAFQSCGLTSVTIGNSVTSIGSYAFRNCTSLTSVTIGNSVTSIGDYVFSSCYNLMSVKIPDSVTSIGRYAFYLCSRLTSVTIGDSVTSIGSYAFDGCSSLTEITVDENNPNYCSVDGNLYNKDKTQLIQYAIGKQDTSFTIPDSVTSIGDYAFQDCKSLTKVVIGNSVTSIGSYAFRNCSSLTEVVIPNSVTSIGDWAFSYCSSLTSVIIPDSVTSIGSYAFSYCKSLISITYNGTVAQWNAIEKGEDWAKSVPATEVVCTDGVVSLQ